jgi:signal transduction histidine kinase/CheY-like chemotaxis protein
MLIQLSCSLLDVPVVLPLLAVPTALSAALFGLPTAAAVAVGETVLLIVLRGTLGLGEHPGTLLATLTAVWSMVGIMAMTYRPVHQITQWSWDHYRQAQSWLQEMGDRQIELKEAFSDLADANLQLTRLNMLAQGLRQEAEDARRAKEQFVAVVSHELRTPLNMIIGFSEMIIQMPAMYGPGISAKLLADLNVILRNAQHLSKLVDDVLDLGQIEAGRMSLTRERISFGEIVELAEDAVRPLYESKGLCLEVEIQEHLPLVYCDPTRIRQVVLNLLSNAGRFTHSGGVRLRAWREEESVVASVTDTGPGIPSETMSRLFQPFQQADGSIRRRYGGTGLGLSISKQFIELHGGEIWVESEIDVGTTFYFRLPIDPPFSAGDDVSRWVNPYLHYEERLRPSRAPVAVVRPRYVVVEAGNALRRFLTRYVDGVEIAPVRDVQEAVQEIKQTPAQALLVNDSAGDDRPWSWPGPIPMPHGIPIITCSIPDTHNLAGPFGVTDYLVKPVAREVLLKALDRLDLEGKTVLIVDDEPDALRLFRRMLASSGRDYRMYRATDGREAIHILCEQHVDVVLLDLVMPNMDGFRFLAEKNQDPVLRDVPVIVVSARDPMGQPIVSHGLAVTQSGGLSISQLLECVEAITRALSTVRPVGDSGQSERRAG